MPRKKRRDSRKEPLEFVESPVNILHGLLSPVFASDHPCTANVVPVEDLNRNWVSPQFHGPPTARRRGTRARRPRNNYTTDDMPPTINKHVPLKFLGDKSPSPEPLSTNNNKKKGKLHESENSSGYDEVNIDTPVRRRLRRSARLSTERTQLKVRLNDIDVYGIKATGAYKRLQEHQAQVDEEDELPTDFTQIKSVRKKANDTKRKGNRLNLSDENFEIPADPVHDNIIGSDSSKDSNSPILGTQHLPKGARTKTKKKRLFSDFDTSISEVKNDEDDQTMEELPDASAVYFPNNIDTPELRDIVTHLQPPASAIRHNVLPENDRTGTPTKSVRLKWKLLADTPVRILRNQTNILAYDTPESEYGLTVRQRQMKHSKTRTK